MNFVFVMHKHLFVFRVCVSLFFCSKINFAGQHKPHSRLKKTLHWIQNMDTTKEHRILSRHFNQRTSPLAHFFFRRPKFQFPPLDFGAVAQVKWSILLPPPLDRTDQGIHQTRLTLHAGQCPIRC
jgi:hypothetical protein